MLLNSLIIVLREVLEAALLLSVMMATSRILRLSYHWLAVAIVLGVCGAVAYGYYLQGVSHLFDGFGQEIYNALIQLTVFATLATVVFLIACRTVKPCDHDIVLPSLMAIAVSLAITREGLDIYVYVSGFWQLSNFFSAVGVGSLIGAGIGFSIGVLFYYLLLALPTQRSIPVSVALMVLIAAGMMSQAARLLIQADWLTASGILWDTAGIVREGSIPGQLLYALIGYEATPSPVEVAIHITSLTVMTASYFVGRIMYGSKNSAR